jgi:flagellar assembly protein FliH
LSPDVIKEEEFRALYEPADGTDAEAGRPRRFDSQRARIRELLRRLDAAEERERRHVEEAVARVREQALEEAREEYGRAAEAFRGAVDELRATVEGQSEIAGEEIVELAVAVASKVLRREIRRDDEFVVRLVRRCLLRIARRSSVQIRVHPEDHERIAQRAEELIAETGARHEVSIVKDQRVDRGGCVVETPDFVVDGTMRSQLGTAAEALAGEGT